MNDWNTMPVFKEEIPGTPNYSRFTVGNDIIEMVISYPTGSYFEDIKTDILDHYIREAGNKPSNPNRTRALHGRIYNYLRWEYLEELKKVFNDIAAQPVTEKLSKRFSCMGHTFYEGSTPKEIFSWFFRHYTSTCAAGDFSELVMQVPKMEGFFSKDIASYLNV